MIKPTATLTIFIVLLMALKSYGQKENEFGFVDTAFSHKVEKFQGKKIILKTNPFSLLSGSLPLFSSEFRIVGEWVSGPRTSVVAGMSYLGMGPMFRYTIENDSNGNSTGLNSWDFGFNGFRLQGGFRYYLRKPGTKITDLEFEPAPKGWFVQPQIDYSTARFYEKSHPNDYFRFVRWHVTANIGYQVLIGESMTFDPFFGLGYKQNSLTDHGGASLANSAGFNDNFIFGSPLKINFGFNLGFRF